MRMKKCCLNEDGSVVTFYKEEMEIKKMEFREYLGYCVVLVVMGNIIHMIKEQKL